MRAVPRGPGSLKNTLNTSVNRGLNYYEVLAHHKKKLLNWNELDRVIVTVVFFFCSSAYNDYSICTVFFGNEDVFFFARLDKYIICAGIKILLSQHTRKLNINNLFLRIIWTYKTVQLFQIRVASSSLHPTTDFVVIFKFLTILFFKILSINYNKSIQPRALSISLYKNFISKNCRH